MSIQAQNTDINIVPGGIIPVVHVSQYDVGRVLTFKLFDEDSEASLASGTTAVIEGTKPDGHGFQYSASISGNVLTIETTQQMTAVTGGIECKLKLTNGSQTIGTALFIMDVEKAGINDDTIISDTELPLIITLATEQMERAEAAASNAAISETNAANSEIISGSFMRMAGNYAASAENNAIICASILPIAQGYKESAENSAIISGSAMRIAGNYAEESEAHAVGKRNGVDVPNTDPTYHNNSKYWAEYASRYAQGGLNYKGSILFANIPVSGMVSGDMYNMEDDFTTDSRFQEGAGKKVKAGTNIAWNGTKWDVLAMGSDGHTIVDSENTVMPQRAKLKFVGCTVTDDSTNDTTIIEAEGGGGVTKYTKPTITVGTYTYNGTTQAPTITGFDANVMTLTGTYEAINAGSYTFTIALKDKYESKWEDDTRDDIVTNWSIDAISVAVPTVTNTTKTYNGSAQSPTITRDTANTSVSGTTSATKVKSNYSFSIALTDTTNHKWSDNTTAAKSYTWKINPPTGSSYTPVNNIQAWLQCASIDKTYTTISQVLADATTLSALMLSNNAVDYLVRSTSWVSNITGNQTAMTDIGASDYCANKLLADSTWRTAICDSTYFESVLNVKVPTMTSNTTPSGEASAIDLISSGYPAFCAFDGNDASIWISSGVYDSGVTSASGSWIQYKFASKMTCYRMDINPYNAEGVDYTLKGSNNGTSFTTIATGGTYPANTLSTFVINNTTAYQYYRLESRQKYMAGQAGLPRFCIVQFYGRASS